jgi:RNA polymerase sigma-70 factor (ECF subfamily)
VPRQAGDPSSHGLDFAEYYREHLSHLIWHLMRLGASSHEAAESAQAAFSEAFRYWGSITHPRAWLRQVAFRIFLARPARTGEILTDEVPETPNGDCPLGRVEIRDEEAVVIRALAALPPSQRRVMAWVLDGYTTDEIAEELRMTPETVRQNLCRARARLKDQLGLTSEGGVR